MIKNLRSNTIVLCYHRILDDSSSEIDYPKDGQSLKVNEFEKHLIYFKKHYNFVNQLRTQSNNKNKYNLFLTFDDGFKDIKTIVLPLLEKYDIPAMIFLTSGFIDNNNQFVWWIDFWNNIKEKKSITFFLNNAEFTYDLSSIKSKNIFYSKYSRHLFKMNRDLQYAFFKTNNFETNSTKHFLSKKDITELQNHNLIKIGFHSHLHLNFGIETDINITNDIDEMINYFENHEIQTYNNYFALCYGATPDSKILNLLESRFEFIFALGIKQFFSSNRKIVSRININSNQSFFRLKINLLIVKLILFLKKYQFEK